MIALNATAQVFSLGGMLLVQTAFLIFAARILGVEDFGRFSFVFGISQILLMGGDLGLHNTAIRKISYQPAKSQELFPLFFSLKVIVSGLLALGMFLLALLVSGNFETRAALALFGAGLFFHSVNLALNIGFQAHGKLYFASLNSFIQVLVNAAAGLAGLLLGGGIVALGWAYLGTCVMVLCVNWIVFQRRIHEIALVAPRGGKALLAESFPVGLSALFDAGSARIALILLAALAGNYATGIFAASSRITGALRNVPVAVVGAVLPALALHRGRPAQVRGLVGRTLALMTSGAALAAAALWFASPPLVGWVYGAAYGESAEILQVLALSLIPFSAASALNSLLVSQPELFRRLPWVAAAGLAVNLAGNLVLIPLFGGKGAALSALASETATALCAGIAAWSFLRNAARTPPSS